MILPAFKAGDAALRGPDGGFDSHTLPPTSQMNFSAAWTIDVLVLAVRECWHSASGNPQIPCSAP